MSKNTPSRTPLIVFLVLAIGALTAASASAADIPERPNIILILCDDAGFADFGFTGGPVDTPHLDRLAEGGRLFTRAYNNARCMPTRASLMTGANTQRVQMYNELFPRAVTLPEALAPAGYANYMIGKWHLGNRAPHIPTDKGFDRFYGIWEGAAPVNKATLLQAVERKEANDGKGFAPEIIEDGRALPWDQVPDDYYNTVTWTDKAIEFIEATPADQPFFLYASHTAPHWPLDPLPEYLAQQEGRFDEGWDVIRQRILDRQKELGLIPPDYPLPPPPHGVPPFAGASARQISKYTEGSEKYYASIEEMDTQIGRLIETLERTGRADNTLVLFLSDNGPDSVIGGPYRGQVSATPFTGFKLTYHEGGARTPLIAWWPGVIQPGLDTENQIFLEDIMPTLLELVGTPYPETKPDGTATATLDGVSLVPLFGDPEHRFPLREHCWAHDGQRGVLAHPWKAILMEQRHPSVSKEFPDRDGWYLYNLEEDPTETVNLAESHPEQLRTMVETWKAWARDVGWKASPRFNAHPTDEAYGIQPDGVR